MAAVLEKQSRHWTYDEYYQLDDDQRYEIIGGNLLMAPGPDTWHQIWARELFKKIEQHVQKKRLGEVFFAPLDVVLDSENVVQPDLIFISKANAEVIQQRGIFGTPDLVVEIISPGSSRRDRHYKMELYARFGIKEYWIADAADRGLEIFALKDDGYELHSFAEEKGKLTSLLLPGLKFDLSEIE